MSGNFSVPSSTHPVLNQDGTMNRIWYNYLQGLSGVASAPQVNAVAAETRPPAQPEPDENDIAPTSTAPEPTASKGPIVEGDYTEPAQGAGNIVAIVEQVLQNYALIP